MDWITWWTVAVAVILLWRIWLVERRTEQQAERLDALTRELALLKTSTLRVVGPPRTVAETTPFEVFTTAPRFDPNVTPVWRGPKR